MLKNIHLYKLNFSLFFLLVIAFTTTYGQSETNILAVGDISWSFMTNQPDAFYLNSDMDNGWHGIPYLNNPESIGEFSKKSSKPADDPAAHYKSVIHYGISFKNEQERNRYPLKKIASNFRESDITLINLETPLSDTARWSGSFRTPESFGDALQWAGVDVANIANNHMLDAGEMGLQNTIEALKQNEIGITGGGENLETATKPVIIQKNGLSFGFLGYAQFVNVGKSGFALPEKPADLSSPEKYEVKPARSGVAPMDPLLIKKDIKALKDKVDFVILSLHGLIENSKETLPMERDLYQKFIDFGADIIFGSHPHVPRGVEIYEEHPIIYSSGNFIFGHNHTYWGDNYLTNFIFDNEEKQLKKLEIMPVAGKGEDLAQPFILDGERGNILLEEVKWRSELLNTSIDIKANKGIIEF